MIYLAMNEAYSDLKTFREAKRRLHIERDSYLEELDDHWEILCSGEARSALLKNTALNTLRKLGPFRIVDNLIQGKVSSDSISGIGSLFGTMLGSPLKRLLFTAGSSIVGNLFGTDENDAKGPLGKVVERIGGILRKFRSDTNTSEERLDVQEERYHS